MKDDGWLKEMIGGKLVKHIVLPDAPRPAIALCGGIMSRAITYKYLNSDVMKPALEDSETESKGPRGSEKSHCTVNNDYRVKTGPAVQIFNMFFSHFFFFPKKEGKGVDMTCPGLLVVLI